MKTLTKSSILGLLVSTVFYLVSCGGGGGSAVTPTGSGTFTFDPVTKVISGSITVMNIANTTAAHIHDGNVGVDGPVVVGLVESPPATWSVPANTILTDAQIARLQAGGYYVNVHTTQNPNGEIRGQLTASSTNPNVFNATLSTSQEVANPIVQMGGY